MTVDTCGTTGTICQEGEVFEEGLEMSLVELVVSFPRNGGIAGDKG